MAKYLVTGASGGLGRALARELCGRGHQVWGVSRRQEELFELQHELGCEQFFFSVCDVVKADDVHQTVHAMARCDYIPDIIILNAAINPERYGQPFILAEFKHILEVNLFGALVWVESFLPIFQRRKVGQFVAISSLAAYRGDARWVAYSASKAALDRSFESLRGRHERNGMAFTVIHLGAVNTGMGLGSRGIFTMSEARAVGKILAAIEHRVACVTVPRHLRLCFELTRVLPDWLFSRIVLGALRNASTENSEQ